MKWSLLLHFLHDNIFLVHPEHESFSIEIFESDESITNFRGIHDEITLNYHEYCFYIDLDATCFEEQPESLTPKTHVEDIDQQATMDPINIPQNDEEKIMKINK